MLKHRYSHYEIMVEYETCGKGFQLTEHHRVHQLVGDWVCFRPGCGKRFKRELELDAHLFNHRTTKIKCDYCTYENADPHNVHAHKESMTIKKVLFVKDADKHLLGSNNVNNTSQITNAPVNQTNKIQM